MCCTSPALLQCWPFVRSCKSYWCKLYPSSDSVEHGSISNMIVSFHFGWIFPLNHDFKGFQGIERVPNSPFLTSQVWSWIRVTRSLDLFRFTMASFSRMLCNSWTWEAVILLLTCCRAWGNKMQITFSPKDEASKLPTLGFLSGCWWETMPGRFRHLVTFRVV